MDNEEKEKNYELARKLLSEQNLPAAMIGGAVATVLASAAYGMTVTTWAFSYGFAAAGVGAVIGLTMGFLGRGIEARFSVAAALYTAIGCLFGNLFRAMIELAPPTATSLLDVFAHSSFAALWERSTINMFSIELLYWLVAVVAAVFLARRPLSRSHRLALGLLAMRG